MSHLVAEIKRLGQPNSSGQIVTTFGVLFHDDKIQNLLESLVGTMKAAKKKKIIDFKGLQFAQISKPSSYQISCR